MTTTITCDDFVPPALWDRDHWSTLAYLETKVVDGRTCALLFDAHMRQNRRNFRVLWQHAKSGGGGSGLGNGLVMNHSCGTRLKDGNVLRWHDDWCCVQDMIKYGLVHGPLEDFEPGFQIRFTELGLLVASELRKHKATGGSFSNFKCSVELSEVE